MEKFSEMAVFETVHTFRVVNQVALPDVPSRRLAAVAQVSWNQLEPVSVRTQHEFVFCDDVRAGHYRESVLVNSLGQMRDYPCATTISQLMTRLFIPAYHRVMKGEAKLLTEQLADAAWQIGAMLRAIHPFEVGNLILSWVLENQVRLRFGLPLSVGLRPKEEFDQYRYDTFFPLVDQITA